MKFGQPISRTGEVFFYLGLSLLLVSVFHRYFNGDYSFGYAVTWAVIFGAMVAVGYLSHIRNKEAPLFEIRNRKLYYKSYFGTVKEYDLRKMRGRVESKGAYLLAPGLVEQGDQVLDTSHLNDKIYMGRLKKKERQRFMQSLSNYVRSHESAD